VAANAVNISFRHHHTLLYAVHQCHLTFSDHLNVIILSDWFQFSVIFPYYILLIGLLFNNKNTFCGTRYPSHCCSLYPCGDIKPNPGFKLDLVVTWHRQSHDQTFRYICRYLCFPNGAFLKLTQIWSPFL